MVDWNNNHFNNKATSNMFITVTIMSFVVLRGQDLFHRPYPVPLRSIANPPPATTTIPTTPPTRSCLVLSETTRLTNTGDLGLFSLYNSNLLCQLMSYAYTDCYLITAASAQNDIYLSNKTYYRNRNSDYSSTIYLLVD